VLLFKEQPLGRVIVTELPLPAPVVFEQPENPVTKLIAGLAGMGNAELNVTVTVFPEDR